MIVIRRNYLMGCISLLGVFIIGILGCGEDSGGLVTEADDSGHEAGVPIGPPPKVVSVNISEGQKVPNDEVLIVVAKFNKKMEEATISISDAAGIRFSSGKEATWMSMEAVPVGPHTLTIRGYDTFRQELKGFEPIHFFVTGDAPVGDIPDEDKGPLPMVKDVNIAPGQEIPGNMAIIVRFTKEMDSVQIEVSDAVGVTTVNGSQATWVPASVMPPGQHTLTVKGKDTFGQPLDYGPKKFSSTAPDVTPPAIDSERCWPRNGAELGFREEREFVILTIGFTEPLESVEVVSTSPHLNLVVMSELSFNNDTMFKLLIQNFNEIPKGAQVQITLELKDKIGSITRDEYILNVVG